MSQAAFTLKGRNPDVLSCIANLSNDEVFTPPEFANRMLDTLADAWAADHDGGSIWANPDLTFLDPCTKSGVFLREITKRLIDGLEAQIPELQTRVDHILSRQVFGIGITELTAMLARRSLYCSKHADGPHSIARVFSSETGNVWFERVEHNWDKNGKCTFCGASGKTLDRGEDRESHAYAFIHTDDIQARISALFGGHMQFDVVIGNPPYQLDDGGHGTSAAPIYQLFVEKTLELDPNFAVFVTPSRWMAGGKGLNKYRERMLSDRRLRSVVDYPIGSQKVSWISREKVKVNEGWIDRWKVLMTRVQGTSAAVETKFLSKPILAGPGTACTETYLVAGHFDTPTEAKNYARYLCTRFVRFLVSLRKSTQDAAKGVYSFVPDLPLDSVWTDAELYRRYGLSEEEIAFIEDQVAPQETDFFDDSADG